MSYSKEELLAMYRTLMTSRFFDEEMIRQNKMGHLNGMFHWSINEEAIDAASVNALRKEDYYMPSHRNRGLHLSQIGIKEYLAECMGLKSGHSHGTSCDFHIVDLEKGFVPNPGVLGAGSPIAVGFAFGIKRTQPGKVILQVMGDGTFNQGMVHEAMNWAVIQKLPIIFVVRNNQWQSDTEASVYMPVDNICDRARACGMDAVSVDGQDVIACREALDVAIERARTQNMPSLIEAKTYRFHGHFNGDPLFYRNPEKHAEMLERYPDPVPKYENYMIETGLVTREEIDAIRKEMKKSIKEDINEVYQESLDPANFNTGMDLRKDKSLMYANYSEGLE